MKRAITLILMGLACMFVLFPSAKAADLIVEENGVLPNYGTIQDAVNAASDGDRIFVKNKSGNVPYQENVTINVSIELLPFDANGQYIVWGEYTINPIIDRTVTIIGMLNQDGSITCNANSPAGNPTRINVFGTELLSGSINISGTNIVSHVSGNKITSGSITTRYSTVTGNQVTSGSILINPSTNFSTEDTLYVVGNRVSNGRIQWGNGHTYFYIANNFIIGSTIYQIYCTQVKAGNGVNSIVNNSTYGSGGNNRGIYVTTVPANSTLQIHNNALRQTTTAGTNYPIYVQGIAGLASYTFNTYNGWDAGLVCNPCASAGNQNATIAMDVTTGECTSVPSCVDAGNPSTDHTDLDLTRNDVGTKGGSFNFNNFFPILTGGARVYLVRTPRTVVQTSTIRAEADGYDR